MSTPPPTGFSGKLREILSRAEWILLAAAVAVLLAYYSGYDVSRLVMIVFLTLACVYFLLAFSPPPPVEEDGGQEPKLGFAALLFSTILPKVNGIAAANGLVGITFYLLKLEGSRQMLLIGGTTLAASVVLSGIGMGMGIPQARNNASFLYRSIPLALLTLYCYNQS